MNEQMWNLVAKRKHRIEPDRNIRVKKKKKKYNEKTLLCELNTRLEMVAESVDLNMEQEKVCNLKNRGEKMEITDL